MPHSMLSSLLLATWQNYLPWYLLPRLLRLPGGLILGILLYLSHNKKPLAIRLFNQVVGFIVNVTRSIPYIILLILLYPITKLIVGTTIGTTASIVPLAIAALPFYGAIG